MSNKQKRQFDVDLLREIADPETVAEALGIPMERRGSRISILCPRPDHNDRHFGSCYLTNHGWHCFRCGEGGDAISLVELSQGYSFTEACTFLEELFDIRADKKSSRGKSVRRLSISDEDLRMIGLLPDAESPGITVCRTLRSMVGFDRESLGKHQVAVMRPYLVDSTSSLDNTLPTGVYSIEECIDRTPLRSLFNNDETAFRDMIATKAREAAESYAAIAQGCLSWDMKASSLCMVQRCEELCDAYGGTPKREKVNVFGAFKGGGSI